MSNKRPKIREYSKNLAQSIKYGVGQYAGNSAPAASDFIMKSSDIYDRTRTLFIEKKSGLSRADKILSTNILTDGLNNLKTSTLDSLRSGKFYNNDNNIGGSDFGDFGESDFMSDFSSDYGEDEDSESTDDIERPTTNSESLGNQTLINAIGQSTADSAEYIGASIDSGNKISASLSISQHMENLNLFKNMDRNLAMISANTKSMVDSINDNFKFYENVTAPIIKLEAMFDEFIKMQRNVYKTDTVSRATSNKGANDIMGYGFDPDSYIENIKKNFNNSTLGSALELAKMGSGGDTKSMIKQYTSNPLGAITDTLIKNVIPNITDVILKDIDKAFEGFLPSVFMKFNDVAKSNSGFSIGSEVLNFMNEIFGVNVNVKHKINTSVYNKEAISFDGITKKSIVEVIPTYLANIQSLLSNQEAKYFDYKEGKFKSKDLILKKFNDRKKSSFTSDMYDTRNAVETNLESTYTNYSERKKFMDDYYSKFEKFLVDKQYFFDPKRDNTYKKMNAKGLKLPGDDPEKAFKHILDSWINMSRGDKLKSNSEIMKAGMSLTDFFDKESKGLQDSGLSIAFNNGQLDNKKSIKANINGNDDLQGTTGILNDIKAILLNGLVVYNQGKGKISNIRSGYKKMINEMTITKSLSTTIKETDKTLAQADNKPVLNIADKEYDINTAIQSMTDDNGLLSGVISGDTVLSRLAGKYANNPIVKAPIIAINSILLGVDKLLYSIIYGRDNNPNSITGKINNGGLFNKLSTSIGTFWNDKQAQLLSTTTKFMRGAFGFGDSENFSQFDPKLKSNMKSIDFNLKESNIVKRGFLDDFGSYLSNFFTGKSRRLSNGKVLGENKDNFQSYISNFSGWIKEGIFGSKEKTNKDGKLIKSKDGILTTVKDELLSLFGILDINGKKDKDGKSLNTKDQFLNLLPSSVKDFVSKNGRSMGSGGLIGGIASIALPGGFLFNSLIGSGIAFASKSEEVKNALFGKFDKEDNRTGGIISKTTQEWFGKYGKGISSGAVLGGFGSLILPGSGLMGIVAGSLLGLATSTEEMKEKFFGKKDEKGNYLNGIGKILQTSFVDPFKKWKDKSKLNIVDWFNENIKQKWNESLEPMKDQFSKFSENLGDAFKNATKRLNETFEDKFGTNLSDLIETKLMEPFRNGIGKITGLIGKILGGILSSPIKLLNALVTGKTERTARMDKRQATLEARRERRNQRMNNIRDRFNIFKGVMSDDNENIKDASGNFGYTLKNIFSNLGANISLNGGGFGGLFSTIFGNTETDDTDSNGGIFSNIFKKKDKKEKSKFDSNGPINFTMDEMRKAKKDRSLVDKDVEDAIMTSMDTLNKSSNKKETKNNDDGEINNVIQMPMDKINRNKNKSINKISKSSDVSDVTGMSGSLFKSIFKTIKNRIVSIDNSTKNQLNGVGWNLQYLTNMFTEKYGKPKNIPDDSNAKTNKKRRGILGRTKDKIVNWKDELTDKFKGLFGDKWTKTKDFVGNIKDGVFNAILFPFKVLGGAVKIGGKSAKFLAELGGDVLREGAGLVKGIGLEIGSVVGTALRVTIESLGDILKSGLNILTTATGMIKDGFLGLTGVLREGLPALAGLIGDIALGTGSVIYHGGKLFGGAIKNVAGSVKSKIFNRTASIKTKFDKATAQKVMVVGGHLDSISDPVKALIIGMSNNPTSRGLKLPSNKRDSMDTNGNGYYDEMGRSFGDAGDDLQESSLQTINKSAKMLSSINSEGDYKSATLRTLHGMSIGIMKMLSAITGKPFGSKTDYNKESGGLFGGLGDLGGNIVGGAVGGAAAGGLLGSLKSGLAGIGTLATSLGTVLAIPGFLDYIGVNVAKKDLNNDGTIDTNKEVVNRVLTNTPIAGSADRTPFRMIKQGVKYVLKHGPSVAAHQFLDDKSALNMISDGLTKILHSKSITKILGKNADNIISKIIHVVLKSSPEFLSKFAFKVAGYSFAGAGLIIDAALFAADLSSGMAETRRIFRLPQDFKTTWNLNLSAGLGKAISGFLLGIPDPSWLGTLIYNSMVDTKDEANLKQGQLMLEKETIEFNESNGTNYTTEEYNNKINKKMFGRAWEGTKNIASNVWDGTKNIASNAWDATKSGATKAWNASVPYVNKGLQILNLPNYIVEKTFTKGLEYINNNAIVKDIKESVTNVWDSTKTAASEIFGDVKTGTIGLYENIKGATVSKWRDLKTGVSNLWDSTKSISSMIWGKTKDGASNLWDGAKTLTGATWNNFKNGVSNVWGATKNIIATIWEKVNGLAFVNTLKDFTKEKWDGVTEAAINVWNSTKSVASSAWNATKTGASNAWNATKTGVSNAWNTTKTGASNVWNGIDSAYDFKTYFNTDYVNQIDIANANKEPGGYAVIDDARYRPTKPRKYNYVSQNTATNDLAKSGCGPAVATMAVNALGVNDTTLESATAYALKNGYKTSTSGTHSDFFNSFGENYGVNFRYMDLNNTDGILNKLKAGQPLVFMGKRDSSIKYGGDSVYPNGSHYILATGLAPNGEIQVLDPGDKTNNHKTFNYDRLIAETTLGMSVSPGKVISNQASPDYSMDASSIDEENTKISLFDLSTLGNDLFEAFLALKSASPIKSVVDKIRGKSSNISSSSTYNGKWLTGDTDMQDWLLSRVDSIGNHYNKKISITSGYRTFAEQQRLYDKYKAGVPGAAPAAVPGRSRHNYGLAFDSSTPFLRAMSASKLAKLGLHKPVEGEPWHFEAIETKGKSLDLIRGRYGTPDNQVHKPNFAIDWGRGTNVKPINTKALTRNIANTTDKIVQIKRITSGEASNVSSEIIMALLAEVKNIKQVLLGISQTNLIIAKSANTDSGNNVNLLSPQSQSNQNGFSSNSKSRKKFDTDNVIKGTAF